MDDDLKLQIKQLIIDATQAVDVVPADIGEDNVLFEIEKLGMDSLDVLEIIVLLKKRFGVHIGDQNLAIQILRSVNSIAEFIESSRNVAA